MEGVEGSPMAEIPGDHKFLETTRPGVSIVFEVRMVGTSKLLKKQDGDQNFGDTVPACENLQRANGEP